MQPNSKASNQAQYNYPAHPSNDSQVTWWLCPDNNNSNYDIQKSQVGWQHC